MKRVVVHFAAGDDRDLLVQQRDELSQNAALRLASQAEQDEVVPRENGVDGLWHDRLLEPDDAGEDVASGFQHANEILAHLVLDRALAARRLPPLSLL